MVLYKHGVGYVERRGKLKGEVVELEFKREGMNDVLKSLLVLDNNGKVTGVSYESHEQASEKLKNALVIPEDKGVIGLLKALTGYDVVITTTKLYKGKIVGIEKEERVPAQAVVIKTASENSRKVLVILDEKGKTHFIGIEEIKNVEIIDENVLADLKYFLELTAAERKHDVKAVTVHLDNDKMHDLSISYITEMPVWRTSYRFAYEEKGSLLQGWGIMDNSLEEDLEEVEISLVAGQPISFVYDFYAPPLTYRPTVREQARAVAAPVEMEDRERNARDDDNGPVDMQCEATTAGGSAHRATPKMVPPPGQPKAQIIGAYAKIETKAQNLGAFFRYDILNPVTIKRGESAMLPILQQKIDCEKTFVYNQQKNPDNPMVALKFENKTGLTLERGPLTVYDEGMYVGEAILPFTTEGQEQFIVYAVELGIKVSSEQTSALKFKEAYLSNVYLIKLNYETTTTTYKLTNKTKKSAKVLLEHQKWSGYELIESKKPDEETESYYRWKLEIPAGKTIEFKLAQGRTTSYNEYLQYLSIETLEEYVKQGELKKEVKELAAKVVSRYQKIKELQDEKVSLNEERGRFSQDQERMRKNIGALSQASEEGALRKKYVKQLEEQEDRVQQINKRITEIDGEIHKLEKEINEIAKTFE